MEFNTGLFCPSWGTVCLGRPPVANPLRKMSVGEHHLGLQPSFILFTLFPRRDKKGLRWTPLTTVPKKFHYFSNLKNVFKTWFRRPTNDLIELCFLWFYMCFCKKNHLNRYFETLYGLFSSWWPNRVIIWYFEPKKPKISVFWGIVCFVATFLQVLICKITRKTTWKNHKKGSTG